MNNFEHVTVLKKELVDAMNLHNGDICIDATMGGGGHTRRCLDKVGNTGRVIAFDRDENAINYVKQSLKHFIDNGCLHILQEPFSLIESCINSLDLTSQVSSICADIGVSSPQLDDAERGFSFRFDGPLDMRMDQSKGQTAAKIIDENDTEELAQLFRDFGEEPKAFHYARAIKERHATKPFVNTLDLAEFIKNNNPYKKPSKKHPATKIFQALRIAVNDELGQLERFIDQSFSLLKPSGRLAIISFHSLEDRLIKNKFKVFAGKSKKQQEAFKGLPLSEDEVNERIGVVAKIIKPFPLIPSEKETTNNPRARSAKLRVIEKL